MNPPSWWHPTTGELLDQLVNTYLPWVPWWAWLTIGFVIGMALMGFLLCYYANRFGDDYEWHSYNDQPFPSEELG
jgi:hypothetical protein